MGKIGSASYHANASVSCTAFARVEIALFVCTAL